LSPQERAWQAEQGKAVGPTLLFFGCRNRAQDYIYEEELEAWAAQDWFTLHVAFSRDQVPLLTSAPPPFPQAEKRYVTHMLREQGPELWSLLDQGAHIYVCGDAKMMAKVSLLTRSHRYDHSFQDVRNIVGAVCREHGGMAEEEAEAFVKKLESQKRYSSDVWS
jgi:NADPH-ferrihemoprotein reductase